MLGIFKLFLRDWGFNAFPLDFVFLLTCPPPIQGPQRLRRDWVVVGSHPVSYCTQTPCSLWPPGPAAELSASTEAIFTHGALESLPEIKHQLWPAPTPSTLHIHSLFIYSSSALFWDFQPPGKCSVAAKWFLVCTANLWGAGGRSLRHQLSSSNPSSSVSKTSLYASIGVYSIHPQTTLRCAGIKWRCLC